jgi:hypothetical protein
MSEDEELARRMTERGELSIEYVKKGSQRPIESSDPPEGDEPPGETDEEIKPTEHFPVLDIPDAVLAPIADRASYVWVDDDGMWIATIDDPQYRGVVAVGDSYRHARDELILVLREWLSLGHYLHHELPTIEGVDFGSLASR